MESVKTIMWRSTTPERYARVLRLLTLRRKKIESLTAEVAQKDAEVERLRGALFALYMDALQTTRYGRDSEFTEKVDRAIEVYPHEEGLRAALEEQA